MSDATIFIVGAIVFFMLTAGLAFTVFEFRRLGQEAANKQKVRSQSKISGPSEFELNRRSRFGRGTRN